MSDTSRRGFLAIAGAGAAGVAVASVAGVAGSAAASEKSKTAGPVNDATELPAGASGPLVAYVTDVRDGRVSVLVGENEVQIRDRELVARLAQAAHTAASNATGA